MDLNPLYRDIESYCLAKGARPGPGVNNFIPHDPVHAYAMAVHLTTEFSFDHLVSVAPEGHIYGYFFEKLGHSPLSVHVPYPPTHCEVPDDFPSLAGGSVLIIEDDVIGGATLRHVVKALQSHQSDSLSLYLGHSAFVQKLENVPDEIDRVFRAETDVDPKEYLRWEGALEGLAKG